MASWGGSVIREAAASGQGGGGGVALSDGSPGPLLSVEKEGCQGLPQAGNQESSAGAAAAVWTTWHTAASCLLSPVTKADLPAEHYGGSAGLQLCLDKR